MADTNIDFATAVGALIKDQAGKVRAGKQIVTGAHLDTYTTPDRYFQTLNTNAKLSLGYPVERAGAMDVLYWGYSDGPTVIQVYYPYNSDSIYWRHIYYGSKTWKEVPSKAAVQGMIDAAVGVPRSSRTSVVAIGDSLTDGYSNGASWPLADKWPTILDGLLPSATVTEYGLAGHTVDGTMLYIGAHRPQFTIPGGTIPANGTAVPVTTSQVYGIPQGLSIGGVLAGVTGVLGFDYWGGGGWTFRSLNGGTASGLTGLHEFRANQIGTWEASTAVIWLGRNDISNGATGQEATVPDHIVASHRRLIAELSPRVKQVMVCGVTTRVSEETGSVAHNRVTETNRRLREAFPDYFHSAQDYLRDRALTDMGVTPTAQDSAKIAAGTLPPSVMDDDTHISKAAADAMARKFFRPFLTGRGYVA